MISLMQYFLFNFQGPVGPPGARGPKGPSGDRV